MNNNKKIENSEGDFFFWLGADGTNLVSMTKTEFQEQVKKEEQKIDDYLNARTTD